MSVFRMPSLGSDMERAILVEWLVEPGSTVKRGDIVAVVETDKGAIEIEVFESGVLTRYLASLGDDVPVGGPLAEINGTTAASATDATAVPQPAAVQEKPRATAAAPRAAAPATAPGPVADDGGVRASPAARRLAAQRGVDLSAIRGSGPGGAIVLDDVEHSRVRHEQGPAAAPRRGGIDPAAMRDAIAASMSRSKREIPHYYLKHTIDLAPAVAWLEDYNAGKPPDGRLLPGALFIKATALALVDHAEFNGFFVDGTYRPGAGIHVGTAIAVRGGGLVAPALHAVDSTPLPDLMAQLRDLVARVRAGRFRASELSDPTVTVSSLGDRGVEELYGVIYPPQVACVGFGRIVARPWSLDDGSIATRPVLTITLSADHRVSDGHRGALFLTAIGNRLGKPEAL